MSVFGRIDITFPDGRSETRRLEGYSVAIGSGLDDAIRLPSRFLAANHLRLSLLDDEVYLINLRHDRRTLVDGTPAPVDEPLRLGDFATILVGELRIVFNRGRDDPTIAMAAFSEHTQPSALGFRASLDRGEMEVWPGSSAAAELRIMNLTDTESQFSVETAGLPADWLSPRSLKCSVAAGDSLELLIHVKPAREPNFAPGNYPLTITVARLAAKASSARLALVARLGGYGGLRLSLDPPQIRENAAFQLVMRNHGNEDLRIALVPHEPDGLLDIRLEQSDLWLGAGAEASVRGRVRLRRRRLFGSAETLSFALLAKARPPGDYLAALPASLDAKPLLSRRALAAAILAVALLLVGGSALLYRAPQPEISRFTLSAGRVARGTPVVVSWEGTGAQRFIIQVERARIAELPADAASFSLDTSDYVDPIHIALIARRGEEQAIETALLEVFQPVIVTRFEASQSTMLRRIPRDLKVSWRVEGAVALDIATPLGFETIDEFADGIDGEITLRGAPLADFQITLRAEDELGTVATRAIAIASKAPECAPIEDVLLYAGPDSRFERARFAVRNVPALAIGIDAKKEWLLVERAGGDQGWGVMSAFRCAGFEAAELPVIDDIPPLPSATPPPAATVADS